MSFFFVKSKIAKMIESKIDIIIMNIIQIKLDIILKLLTIKHVMNWGIHYYWCLCWRVCYDFIDLFFVFYFCVLMFVLFHSILHIKCISELYVCPIEKCYLSSDFLIIGIFYFFFVIWYHYYWKTYTFFQVWSFWLFDWIEILWIMLFCVDCLIVCTIQYF